MERARIARELHDELGQSLTGMRMQLRKLQKGLPGQPIRDQDLERILSAVDQTIPEVRRICTELSPSMLDHLWGFKRPWSGK
jgi:signal transduction histidine kinase